MNYEGPLDILEEDRPLLNDDTAVQDENPLARREYHVVFGDVETRAALERSLVRKLDRRMSIMVLIYMLNYIDRNNAAAARLRGFERDLKLEGSQFATILSILYVGYTLMQIPSNMLLNRISKPSLYLPGCMAVWGVISVLTGFTTNYFGALCTRFLLGFVEAAFFPGALFLIARWYTRKELSQRTAILTCGSLMSNAFGSLIASVILDVMEGVQGYAAWRWLFFVEGSITVAVALCSIWILPDFPETPSHWLSPAEQRLAIQRMEEDSRSAGFEANKISELDGLKLALTDRKVWWLAIAFFHMVISLSFNSYFPTLSETMGYNRTVTLLLCAPPWIFATVVSLLVARHSDRVGERCLHIVVPLCIGICGFVFAILTMDTAVRYFSLFLMAQSYAGLVCFLAWASGSIATPPAKRAVGLALINVFSAIGNALGSYVWPKPWGPSYRHSYVICVITSSICIAMCLIFREHLRRLNKRARQYEAEVQRDEHAAPRYLL